MARRLARLSRLGWGLLAAACSPAGSASPLALYPAAPEAHQARLQGRLSLEGDCLYVVGEGGERWLAAFPSPGTRWSPADNTVRVGERSLRVGEAGAFTGGEVTSPAGALRWVQAPAASCDGSKLWMVSSLADP